MSSRRRKAEWTYMSDRYPTLRRTLSQSLSTWTGSIQPLGATDELLWLISDLSNDRPVDVQTGGDIYHLNSCLGPHDLPGGFPPVDGRDSSWTQRFHVTLDEHPYRGWVVKCEELSAISPSAHPHLYPHDGSLCLFHPEHAVLPSGPRRLLAVVDSLAIYLFRHLVWLHTRWWIGSAFDHQGTLVTNAH